MYLIRVFEDVPDKGVCIIPYMRMYLIRVFEDVPDKGVCGCT